MRKLNEQRGKEYRELFWRNLINWIINDFHNYGIVCDDVEIQRLDSESLRFPDIQFIIPAECFYNDLKDGDDVVLEQFIRDSVTDYLANTPYTDYDEDAEKIYISYITVTGIDWNGEGKLEDESWDIVSWIKIMIGFEVVI